MTAAEVVWKMKPNGTQVKSFEPNQVLECLRCLIIIPASLKTFDRLEWFEQLENLATYVHSSYRNNCSNPFELPEKQQATRITSNYSINQGSYEHKVNR